MRPTGSSKLRILEGVALGAIAAQACSGGTFQNTTSNTTSDTSVNPSVVETQVSQAAAGVRVSFHYSDYFSLTSPKEGSNCAGDGRTYYKPLDVQSKNYPSLDYLAQSGQNALNYAGPGPYVAFNPLFDGGATTQTVQVDAAGPHVDTLPYPTSTTLDPGVTLKPSFIKNVSVDLTDSNSGVSTNAAYSCSFGANPAVPPPSSCATFDYGAIGGVPTSLGGTFLLVGGIQDYNYAGYTTTDGSPAKGTSVSCGPVQPTSLLTAPSGFATCPTAMFALGVDTLPATVATTGPSPLAPGITGATGPISTWANLDAVSGATGPQGVAGASVTFSSGLQRVLIFAGASPLVTQGPTNAGSDTAASWAYDLKAQTWQYLNSSPYATNAMLTMLDSATSPAGQYRQFTKGIGARSLFGFVSVPGTGLANMSRNGQTDWFDPAAGDAGWGKIDVTDRILAVGGLTSDGVMLNSQKFNPSFGPEWMDTLGREPAAPAAGTLVQWLDSYHTQLINNSTPGSFYQPRFASAYNAAPTFLGYNFGTTAVMNSDPGSGLFVAGFALSVAGFEATTTNTASTPGGDGKSGNVYYAGKTRAAFDPDAITANYLDVPNDPSGVSIAPAHWTRMEEGGGANTQVPWFGGVSVLPGFSLANNDVAYFGGSSCREYLSDPTLSSITCDTKNPGRYWRLGVNPFSSVDGEFLPGMLAGGFGGWGGTSSPQRAGLASARGEDESGNVIIVAWGGMKDPVVADDTNNIWLLYNQGTVGAPSPRWTSFLPAGEKPTVLTNAAMVFSHVTGKFYVFGGLQASGITKTVNDTWELSVSGACPGCTFTWRKLNVTGGLTCYPSDCPEPRRSHRIVEVNYNNANPTAEPVCTNPAKPCSFGIFMQGGTPNGFTLLSDRWMFDPTANGGSGHWQRVDGFPPRHLASMAPVDFYVQTQTSTVHRALLYGGETALHSPAMGRTGRYYVPPTLSDTFIYDFESNSWNRTELLGKGYKSSIPVLPSQYDQRQAFIADNPSPPEISELSPPPVSGGMMVTRTFPRGSRDSTTPLTPLQIPEVYLIGGRLKDGTYNSFNRVFKFCTATTGERPPIPFAVSSSAQCGLFGGVFAGGSCTVDDAHCDAYDGDTNPDSPGPTNAYAGRWIRKRTGNLTTNGAISSGAIRSYLGAATYDPWNDKIVVFGGLAGKFGTSAVTEALRLVSSDVYEYTPASRVNGTADQTNGSWAAIAPCSTIPTGRYGHNLGYDQLNNQLVLVGGYDVNGTPLVRTWLYSDGTPYKDASNQTFTTPEVWTAKRVETGASVCYDWKLKTTFGNSPDIQSQAPPRSGLAHAAGVFIPASGFNTGFYSLFDNQCSKAGPIATSDPDVNKLLAGGVYIDLDRSALGPSENLLLNLTYIPLGVSNQRPDGQKFGPGESAVFKVHLVKTGRSVEALRSTFQPRHLTYSATDQFPQVVQTLSVLAPPTGSLRQDQLLMPISIDPAIDRIRIERYSGSAILIDATVFRMGYR